MIMAKNGWRMLIYLGYMIIIENMYTIYCFLLVFLFIKCVEVGTM
jgi:hypothetical protein